MNNRQRVLTTLAHQEPDVVPYDIGFTEPARAKMAAYYADPDFERKLGNCFTWFRPHPNDVRYVLTDKDFVNRLLDRILQYNLGIIEHACSLDIDIFRFGDDWGQQRGLIMGIDLWREFIKPRIKRMYELVKSKGKHVMIHCCGKVDGIFPELIECGLDIFNPFQPEVMDVFENKRRYGDRLSFYGGISIQKTLPYGTVEEVKDEVRRLIEIVGENGGYIASPSHDLPADAKAENIAAMIEVLQDQ